MVALFVLLDLRAHLPATKLESGRAFRSNQPPPGGGFFHDAIQKAPGSRLKRLLVLNCAANDRGMYEVEEWFTPSAAQFNTRRRFSRLPGAFYIASRKTPPQRRRNRPKYSRRFRVALAWLDFHGATLDLRCR